MQILLIHQGHYIWKILTSGILTELTDRVYSVTVWDKGGSTINVLGWMLGVPVSVCVCNQRYWCVTRETLSRGLERTWLDERLTYSEVAFYHVSLKWVYRFKVTKIINHSYFIQSSYGHLLSFFFTDFLRVY